MKGRNEKPQSWMQCGIHASVVLLLSITGWSCARSQQFKNDQKYSDYPRSYYYQPGSDQTPSEKIQRLGQPKKRLVIFNFWNNTPVPDATVGAFAADEMKRGLFVSQRVIVPTDVVSQLETQDFVDGDRVRVEQLIREGRRVGVAVLVIGRITKIVFRQRGDEVGLFKQKQSLAAVEIEMKLFDVNAGRELMAIGRTGEASTNQVVALEESNIETRRFRGELARMAVREAVTKLVPDVLRAVEKMSWLGKIAKVVGQKVYLNSGRKSGLVGGDILKVLTPGDDIYDPDSGAFLGRTEGQLKGTLEVMDFVGDDAAVARIHTGGNVQSGDVVRLY